jgi:hypothetical protein
MKSNAERQQTFRDRMKRLGFVIRQIWVHPLDWPEVKRFAERKRKAREQK